ncbi:MAG: hypothetical protein ACRDQ0_22265, partial [Pseudonocardia sp.]
AAQATQLERDLVEVLGEIRPEAVSLTTRLAQLAAVTKPVDPPVVTPPVVTPPVVEPAPEPTPATAPRRHTGTAVELRAAVQELQDELAEHPQARYELTWRRVDESAGR